MLLRLVLTRPRREFGVRRGRVAVLYNTTIRMYVYKSRTVHIRRVRLNKRLILRMAYFSLSPKFLGGYTYDIYCFLFFFFVLRISLKVF